MIDFDREPLATILFLLIKGTFILASFLMFLFSTGGQILFCNSCARGNFDLRGSLKNCFLAGLAFYRDGDLVVVFSSSNLLAAFVSIVDSCLICYCLVDCIFCGSLCSSCILIMIDFSA